MCVCVWERERLQNKQFPQAFPLTSQTGDPQEIRELNLFFFFFFLSPHSHCHQRSRKKPTGAQEKKNKKKRKQKFLFYLLDILPSGNNTRKNDEDGSVMRSWFRFLIGYSTARYNWALKSEEMINYPVGISGGLYIVVGLFPFLFFISLNLYTRR